MCKMRRTSIFSGIAACIAALSFPDGGKACTNIIVTKGASTDGSNMVSYAADSHQLYGELYFRPAAYWQPGSMMKIYEWDTGRFLGEIPQAAYTYKTVGNMNEKQVIIAETTWGGRYELADVKGKLDYGSLIYIALQRAATAREAIDVIVDLAGTYGYCSEGETFSIADKDEVWIMDLIGKGTNLKNGKNIDRGIVWVARRVPDGYICAHANQARIGKFPLDDPDNCLYAPDVISFAKEKGYFEGEDEDFSFKDAYCPADFGTVRGCDARVWSAFNILCNGWFTFRDENGDLITKDAYSYIDYAMGYDLGDPLPLFVKPVRKISVKDVADVMRDHFEGTPMDMTQDIGAGGNGLPYRWRPLTFEYDDKTYVNERAIATQQTGFWFVGQARPYLPDVIGGLLWFGTDDAATSYLTPIYTNVNKVPECFREGNGDMITYSRTSSFWINNRVANACYKMYDQMAPTVREKIDEFENGQMFHDTRIVDSTALVMYNEIAVDLNKRAAKNPNDRRLLAKLEDPFSQIRHYLTKYSVTTANNIFNEWVALEEMLLVKYIDGNVKLQNMDGSFRHTEHSLRIPELIQPGYSDKWKEAVAKDHGETLLMPEED